MPDNYHLTSSLIHPTQLSLTLQCCNQVTPTNSPPNRLPTNFNPAIYDVCLLAQLSAALCLKNLHIFIKLNASPLR
jgi:hypothetical protein